MRGCLHLASVYIFFRKGLRLKRITGKSPKKKGISRYKKIIVFLIVIIIVIALLFVCNVFCIRNINVTIVNAKNINNSDGQEVTSEIGVTENDIKVQRIITDKSVINIS